LWDNIFTHDMKLAVDYVHAGHQGHDHLEQRLADYLAKTARDNAMDPNFVSPFVLFEAGYRWVVGSCVRRRRLCRVCVKGGAAVLAFQ
jgi:hypothetical protein